MEFVKIAEICQISNGYAFKSGNYVDDNGARIIRITNVQKGEIVDNDPKFYPFNLLDSLDNYKILEGDILMSLTGNVGRVGKFPKELLPAYINQRICRVMPKDNSLDVNYLFHYLNSNIFENEAIRNSAGAAQLNLSTKWLENHLIPLPSLEEQKAIAARLDKADQIRQLNQQIINHYDELIQALFIDMFGDPVKNEKGWEKKKFGELGNFKNGLNYNKVDKGYKIKVIGVGDFKNYWKIENNNKISTIDIDSRPNNEFNLKVNDLVFVRSNGNKDLVGRCIIYKNNILDEDVSFSGFCIRFRSESNLLNPNFLIHKLQLKSFRKVVFKNGRGANIQNINQQLLSNIKLPIPPLELQNQFAERVQKIEAQKELAEQALQQSEDLFNSLLQQAFKK